MNRKSKYIERESFCMKYFDGSLSQEGIDYYMPKSEADESKWTWYRNRLLYFHISPVMKMAFHFVSYLELCSTLKCRSFHYFLA